jgi:hypothetical protein
MLCEPLLRIPFSVIGRCSSLGEWERHQIQQSHAVSSIVLQDHIRLPVCIFRVKIAAFGSLNRITTSNFKQASIIISNEQAKT